MFSRLEILAWIIWDFSALLVKLPMHDYLWIILRHYWWELEVEKY